MPEVAERSISFPDLCRQCRGCGSGFLAHKGVYVSWKDGENEDSPRLNKLFEDAVLEEATSADTVVLESPFPEVSRPAVSENRIGKFTKIEKLGTGGMAEVWKAWDHHLGRLVALKIRKEDSEQESTLFEREARIAGRLCHPGIASVYETGVVEGHPYIAMQLINGHTLGRLQGAPVSRIVSLVRDAGEAVQFANEKGVIHCDLKPSNIMVEEFASGDKVFLLDFGVSRCDSEGRVSLKKGYILGTPGYIAPELYLNGSDGIDERADVYSLGMTLYEILCGELPFTGSTREQIRQKIEGEAPASIRERNPGVDSELEAIVFKCISPNPADRYTSVKGLSDALNRWLENRSENIGLPVVKGDSLKRKWLSAASVGILALGLGVGALGSALLVS